MICTKCGDSTESEMSWDGTIATLVKMRIAVHAFANARPALSPFSQHEVTYHGRYGEKKGAVRVLNVILS